MTDTTWNEFYDIVREECNKGDTLDHFIPIKAFQAIRSLEQNWSYKWNEKLMKFFIPPNAESPNILELPEDFKSVITVGLSGTDFQECQRNLQERYPEEFSFSKSREPFGFWIQENRWMWFDGLVEGGTAGLLWYNKFTLKDDMEGDKTCPMLKYGLQALLGTTMQLLAPTAREPLWIETYGPTAQMGIKTMHIADAELRRAQETLSYGGLSSYE